MWVIWKLPGGFSTVPSRCFLRDGTVLSYNHYQFLFDGSVQANKFLFVKCSRKKFLFAKKNPHLNLLIKNIFDVSIEDN